MGEIKEEKIILSITKDISITLFSASPHILRKISDEEALLKGEAAVQIQESGRYNYVFSDKKLSFMARNMIVKPFCQSQKHVGSITPHSYTGKLILPIVNAENEVVFKLEFEVLSVKVDYRTDYRFMLEEITELCTELIMQCGSPVKMYFSQDYTRSSRSLYQQFSFIKSIIQSDEFMCALHKITTAPVMKWEDYHSLVDIRRGGKVGRSAMKQITSAAKRVEIPGNALLDNVKMLPIQLRNLSHKKSLDTPENRFIKYVLESILDLLEDVVRGMNGFDTVEREEVLECQNIIEEQLNIPFFKEISHPQYLVLNSPVLQNKEGYREIYKYWLMLEVACKIQWEGGDDVYMAGKRNVAQLYEYWIFFKLIQLTSELFDIDFNDIENLFDSSQNLNLRLKSGTQIVLRASYEIGERPLRIQLSYNRYYKGDQEYPLAGSWSLPMRPDYSFSIWPAEFDIEEAESQELVLHLHFDAKYRIKKLKELYGVDDVSSTEIQVKREDLIKMHAYKDAIRRTAGAYILYPGSETTAKRGFHDIIPGLGAFALRPSYDCNGISQLKRFILDVIQNHMIQSSQWEHLSYYRYRVYQEKQKEPLKMSLPEKRGQERCKPPKDVSVLIGYVKDIQDSWVHENCLYNIRFDRPITPEMAGAEYLVLYKKDFELYRIYKIVSYPQIWGSKELVDLGYRNPSQKEYFVYSISEAHDLNLKGKVVDLKKLKALKYVEKRRPFTVNLLEFIGAVDVS